jgi:vanillate O-demethylase ferredoxin subunit
LDVLVASKNEEAVGILSFELVSTDGNPLPAFSAGSHIDVELREGLVRQYSLCNSPTDRHRYVIAVLRDPASRGGSVAMHDDIAPGMKLRISEPRNHFPLAAGATRSVLVAGGIGVTPILCMAERLAMLGAEFDMHYCTRSPERTAFTQRILQSAYRDRVWFHHDDAQGRPTADFSLLLANSAPGKHLYVCGPSGFLEHVMATARRCGWPDDHIHYEYFANVVLASSDDQPFEVTVASTGKRVRVEPGKSIVEALAEIDVVVATSCEQGVCGTCLTPVLEGVPDHRDAYLTDAEKEGNDQMLVCCSRARSPVLVLDL